MGKRKLSRKSVFVIVAVASVFAASQIFKSVVY